MRFTATTVTATMRYLILALTLLLAALPPVSAQTEGRPREVAVGSALRKQLFETLRPKITRLAGRPVKFQGSMKSLGSWVFFNGSAVNEEGQGVSLSDSESAEVCALWRQQGGAWKLIQSSGGHGDVVYLEWPQEFGAPAALFELRE